MAKNNVFKAFDANQFMNIYKIRQILEKTKSPVFTANDIAKIANLKRSHAPVYIKRMIQKGLLKRIAKGEYVLEEDYYAIASNILANSYISFNSALYFHKVINQVPYDVQVVVPKRIRKKIDGIEFVPLPKDKIFGFDSVIYGKYPIRIAKKEKAAVDILYKYKSIDGEILDSLDKNILAMYAKRMGIATYRRLKRILRGKND